MNKINYKVNFLSMLLLCGTRGVARSPANIEREPSASSLSQPSQQTHLAMGSSTKSLGTVTSELDPQLPPVDVYVKSGLCLMGMGTSEPHPELPPGAERMLGKIADPNLKGAMAYLLTPFKSILPKDSVPYRTLYGVPISTAELGQAQWEPAANAFLLPDNSLAELTDNTGKVFDQVELSGL